MSRRSPSWPTLSSSTCPTLYVSGLPDAACARRPVDVRRQPLPLACAAFGRSLTSSHREGPSVSLRRFASLPEERPSSFLHRYHPWYDRLGLSCPSTGPSRVPQPPSFLQLSYSYISTAVSYRNLYKTQKTFRRITDLQYRNYNCKKSLPRSTGSQTHTPHGAQAGRRRAAVEPF